MPASDEIFVIFIGHLLISIYTNNWFKKKERKKEPLEVFIECTFECRIANRDLINTTLEVQQFIYIEILIWLRSFSNSKTHPIDNCYRFTWGMAWNIGPKVEIATLELPELKNQISDESVGLEEEYDNTYMNIAEVLVCTMTTT